MGEGEEKGEDGVRLRLSKLPKLWLVGKKEKQASQPHPLSPLFPYCVWRQWLACSVVRTETREMMMI